jgi:Arc/MetJ family transcription regulator
MPTEKVSLTLDQSLLAEARETVGTRGLSSFVNTALARALQRERLTSYLAELEQEHGPIDQRTLDQVRDEWPAGNTTKQLRRSA